MYRSGPRFNQAVEVAGYVRVDLDMPIPVLREFIRRFCGGWLNEHAKVRADSMFHPLRRPCTGWLAPWVMDYPTLSLSNLHRCQL